MMEENRHLHQLVQKENFEKKRLSMENEQLSWKMNQGKEYNMLNTSEDPSYLTCLDGPLSMSYCEGSHEGADQCPLRLGNWLKLFLMTQDRFPQIPPVYWRLLRSLNPCPGSLNMTQV